MKQLNTFFDFDYEITSDMVDIKDTIKLSEFEKLLVDVAGMHVEQLGFGTPKLREKNNAWFILKMTMKVNRLPRINEKITVRTWPVAGKKIIFDRDFCVWNSEGENLVEASSKWCVIDANTRKPISKQVLNWNITENLINPCVEPIFASDFFGMNSEFYVNNYVVTKEDIDANKHMTNTRYFDIVADIMSKNNLKHDYVDCILQLHFVNEVLEGEMIHLKTTDNKNNVIINGALNDDTEKPIFEFLFKCR